MFHDRDSGNEHFNVEVPTPNLVRRGLVTFIQFDFFFQCEFYDQKCLENIISHLAILKFIWILEVEAEALLRDLSLRQQWEKQRYQQ